MQANRFRVLGLSVVFVCSALLLAPINRAEENHRIHRMVIIPAEDRFSPFALTINVGDTVEWINNDTDDHTVVSDDPFNDAGHKHLDHLILGTDNNNGKPGIFRLKFEHRGTFVYFCRFHAHLDADSQPTAPGPRGGIQDPTTGNFGTPMSGVITVRGEEDDDR